MSNATAAASSSPASSIAGEPVKDAAAPSGKWANTENFPVGSHLIAAKHRPHVMAFYAFARTIDDVADSPDLSSEEKITRLNGFEAAVAGEAPHDKYRRR